MSVEEDSVVGREMMHTQFMYDVLIHYEFSQRNLANLSTRSVETLCQVGRVIFED